MHCDSSTNEYSPLPTNEGNSEIPTWVVKSRILSTARVSVPKSILP